MFRHCVHCSRHLGANALVEPFPVGRKLAFDTERGRLRVICPHCTRWNLTPLEERWKAVEECERLFRRLRLRAQTTNIGYATVSDALGLVRIGRPLRPEFAAWRYGQEFTRRRRRSAVCTTTSATRRTADRMHVACWRPSSPGGTGPEPRHRSSVRRSRRLSSGPPRCNCGTSRAGPRICGPRMPLLKLHSTQTRGRVRNTARRTGRGWCISRASGGLRSRWPSTKTRNSEPSRETLPSWKRPGGRRRKSRQSPTTFTPPEVTEDLHRRQGSWRQRPQLARSTSTSG